MRIQIFTNKNFMTAIKTCSISLAISLLTSCGSSGNSTNARGDEFEPGHGPFDANGNYREDWADSPPKRRAKTKKKTSTTKKATPAPKKKYIPPTKKSTPPPKKKTYTPPKKKTYTPPKKKAYTPPKKKKYTPPKKKKPAPKKITPKTKPPVYHTVKKGDTLYGLSRKYGSTAALIQKANKLKGTSIRLGQKLIIPRK